MQLEKLRKSHKKEIIIGGLIIVCVISAITITTTRAKYKLIEDIPLARGTINYMPDKEKPVITNVETSVTKTEINVTVSATDNVGVTEYWYQIDNNTPVKGTGNTYKFTGLTAGTTYIVKVYVKDAKGNQSDTTTKSEETTPNGQTSDSILAEIIVKTETPDFSQIATTDEGVFKTEDGMYGGYSYYWRGAATTNHVIFANYCWRIIRINGDNSIRLIYNGNIKDGKACSGNGKNANSIAVLNQKYNFDTNQAFYVGWTYSYGNQRTLKGSSSNAKTQTDNWFNTSIGNNPQHLSHVADGKFCNDRNVQSGYRWAAAPNSSFNYAANERIEKKFIPTLNCSSGDIYTLQVGAITADEAMYAGGKADFNTSYYLYNGQFYWTMSPCYLNYVSSTSTHYAGVYRIRSDGYLDGGVTDSLGIRPVINLKADTEFQVGGNGTESNPYIVE